MNHLERIAQQLPQFGLDGLLLTSEASERYAVGFHGEGTLLITPTVCRYYTDPRYMESARAQVKGAEIYITGGGKGLSQWLKEGVEELHIKTLGVEEGYMTVATFQAFQGLLPCELCFAQSIVDTLRQAKDEGEIAVMIAAQRMAEEAFMRILDFIRVGRTEREIAARLVYELMRCGGEQMSFDPIVVSGPNGSLPHGVPTDRPVGQGEFLTMDFGVKWQGYCSDMTRTVAVGQPTNEMAEAYALVLRAQRAGIAAARAGIPGREIDKAARSVIEDAGFGPYFCHGLGHSVGIEIHESPNANGSEGQIMPVGAVISIEPGIYIPQKFGLRIEDVVVLRENGCENITKSPKELIIL